MSLARAWKRQLLGASGAALMVPGAIGCALIVLAFAGGFSRLGSLGQAFSGPATPAGTVSPPGHGGPSPATRLTSALRAVGAPAGAAGAASLVSRGGAQARQGGAGHSGAHGRSGGPASPSFPGTHQPAPPATLRPPTQPGGGTPPPPTVVNGVVSAATALEAKVPGPVGAVSTRTLQSLGAAVDRILPAHPPSTPTGSTPASLPLGLLAR
jgi:hypothetical protein